MAQGRVVPDWEKVNTLRRLLVGLEAVGIEQVVGMPDASNLCRRSRDEAQVSLELELLDMQVYHEEGDTIRAATMMGEMGVDCLVTLGGDGTNRAAATGSGQIPMVAISTGTNNVFPTMVEGTLAGLAAGLVAQGKLDLSRISTVSKTLNVYIDGQYREMALIDMAFSQERFVAARAIWDLSTLYEVFLTRAEPTSIGLAAVGAALQPVTLAEEGGLHYVLDSSQGDYQPRQPTGRPLRLPAGYGAGCHRARRGPGGAHPALGTAGPGGKNSRGAASCHGGSGRRTSVCGESGAVGGGGAAAQRTAGGFGRRGAKRGRPTGSVSSIGREHRAHLLGVRAWTRGFNKVLLGGNLRAASPISMVGSADRGG